MADKVALVRLRANNEQYDRAMRESARATESIQAALGKLDPKRMDQFGSKLTRNLTVPLAALGGMAVKTAGDFETVFAQMVGLAEVPADEVERLREAILDLAGETAVAPQALAEALYSAASSGLDAAQAMEATAIAAKGQAAGLGQVQDLVSLVASATAAYGAENMSAARAVDILTETIRAGSADPDELAGSLGRTLAVASQLGITFDQVGAIVAELSTAFGNTDIAVTNMSALFMDLLQPSSQAAKALEAAGTSVEELQRVISEDGLLGGLELLRERGFAANAQALGDLFGNVRSYQAAATLLALDQERLVATFAQTADSAGALDDAFGTSTSTKAFAMRQAMVDLQVALVELGQQLLPLATDLVSFVSQVASAFAALPEPVQKGIIAFGGLAAAMGPLLKAGAAGIQVAQGLSKAWDSRALENFRLGLMGVTQSGAGASNTLGGLIHRMGGLSTVGPIAGMAMVGVGSILYGVMQNAQNAARRAAELEAGIRSLAQAALTTGKTVDEVFATSHMTEWFAEHADLVDQFQLDASEMRDALLGTEEQFVAFLDTVFGDEISGKETAAAAAIVSLRHQLEGARSSVDAHKQAQEDLGIATDDAADSTAGFASTAGMATVDVEELGKAVDKARSSFESYLSAVDGVESAEKRASQARRGVADAQRQVEAASKGLAGAQRDVRDAHRGVEDAVKSLEDAHRELADAQREQVEGSDRLRDAERGVEDAERSLAQAQRESLDAQEALNDARATAAERLAKLEQAVSRQTLDEREAKLALARARERQRNLGVRSDGTREPVSALEREEAALAVERAELRLADVIEANLERTKKLEEERAKAASDSSDEVVEARERIEAAAEREKRAEEDLEKAQQRVTEAREEMAQRVADAQAKVAEASERLTQAQERVTDAQERVRDAQQRIVDAKQGVIDAQAEVAAAHRDVADALLEQVFAEQLLREQIYSNPTAFQKYREDLERLATELGPDHPAQQRLQELINKVREVEGQHQVEMLVNVRQGVVEQVDDILSSFMPGFSFGGRRAGGGDVDPHKAYIVGDRDGLAGAEVFAPGVKGTLTPLSEMLTASHSVGPSGATIDQIRQLIESMPISEPGWHGNLVQHINTPVDVDRLAARTSEKVAARVGMGAH